MRTTFKNMGVHLLFAAAICISFPLYGQQQNIINPRVEVQRDYEGRMIELTKPKLPVFIPDSISKFNIELDYTIFDKPYHDLYSFIPLPSVHLSSPKETKQPWAYLRLGTLFQTAPEADILIQAPLSELSALLLSAQHRSFWGKSPRYQQAGTTIADQMKNRTDIRYTLDWERVHFEIGGGYNYDYHTYYGIAPFYPNSFDPANLSSRSFMRDSMAHAFGILKADLSLSSLRSMKEGIEWNFSFGWSQLEDRARMWNVAGVPVIRENLIRFHGDVGGRFRPEQLIGLSLDGSFSNNLNSAEFDCGVFSIHPYYQLHKERFTLTTGLILSCVLNYKNDDYIKTNKFFIYPKIEVSYDIFPNHLTLYANLRGESRHSPYQSLLAENPWLSQNLELRSSDIPWSIEAGIKGKVAKHLGFNLYGQYVKTNNQYCFVNGFYIANLHRDTPYFVPLYNLFAPRYATEERLSAAAELNWSSAPLSIRLIGKYHTYTLSTKNPAYHKPKYESNFSVRYQWRERIIATANVLYRGGVFAPALLNPSEFPSSTYHGGPHTTKINDFTDIGLKLEYRFASWLGLYVEGKNVLNAEKQYYLMYYEPGTLIGGGMTFSF